MGEIQPPLSSKQEFASDRGHAVKHMHMKSLRRQDVCRHQPCRSTAHNDRITFDVDRPLGLDARYS